MNLLGKIATGLGLYSATSLGWGVLNNDFNPYQQGDWNWQYKGASYSDRVGNFTMFSDNKSRYNDYLKGYNKTVGYDFNLVGIDPQQVKRQQIIEDNLYKQGTLSSNENLALIGNPTGANTTSSNNLILENKVGGRSLFVTSFNEEKKRPNWVAYNIRKENLGSTERANIFTYDTNVDSRYQMLDSGVKGFQRGHNFPSSLATANEDINKATFVITNMTAQAGELNTGAWKYLEHYLRDQVKDNNQQVVVLSGNYGSGGIGTQGYRKYVDGVEVPSIMWKVAIFLDSNGKISSNSKSIVTAFPNQQNVNSDWRRYQLKNGNDLKTLLNTERLLPALDKETEEAVLKNAFSLPDDKSKLLSLDNLVNNNFMNEAVISTRAREKGIHNPLLGPLFDPSKSMKGVVISNKRTHSESFELARYNASMMGTGRFTSAIEVTDMSTVQGLMYLAKGDQMTWGDKKIAEVFDYAANSPSLASRINEYFFIPNGMGRVYKEEKGFIPSLFGAVGALIDQSYITNNPVLKSYKSDADSYYTTKNSIFQDLLENSSAAILATTSSIGVYLAVGEPLKAMLSKSILDTQKALIDASDSHSIKKNSSTSSNPLVRQLTEAKHRIANVLIGGDKDTNVGFKLQQIERAMGPNANTPYYDVKNGTLSAYYLDNYARYRGASFFESTAQHFLLDIVNPYTVGKAEYIKLRSAINDYVNEVYRPADIKIVDRAKPISGVARTIEWASETIDIDFNGDKRAIKIGTAIEAIRNKTALVDPTNKGVTRAMDSVLIDEINDVVNKKYAVDITNVSLERSMILAKKTQAILNLIPMPWAWGIFAGRQDKVTAPMIGNLLDIEGFTRHINASISNQGFWGAANEFMYFNIDGNNSNNAAYRITNHIATSTRAILAFNDRGGQSKADLEAIEQVASTYSNAEKVVVERLDKAEKARSYKSSTTLGREIFNTDALNQDEVLELLDLEANYQSEWKKASGSRTNIKQITLDDTLYKYANKGNATNSLGFSLHTLDKGGDYTGMKIASTKLAGAKWIVGALFIPHLLGVEFLQRSGASLLTTALQQLNFNKTTTNTTIELQSTNFVSGREFAKYFGANNNIADVIGNVETLVGLAGITTWAWKNSSSFMPEIHAKLYQGDNVFNSITEIATELDSSTGNYKFNAVNGRAAIEGVLNNKAGNINSFRAKLASDKEVVFSVVRDGSKIVGLQTLNAQIKKNMTSFGITLGLSLTAMQTARYVISSAINGERQLTGSALLSTYALAVPAVIIGTTSIADNIAHTVNLLSGGKTGWNDYKLTSAVTRGLLWTTQQTANIFAKSPLLATTIAATGLLTAYISGAAKYLTPFQGDINGPRLDETNTTAITKLGKYVEHVNRKINNAYNNAEADKGDIAVSDTVSPLEVNGALFAIALSKIMNPILSSQKGSTAYVVAIQSPTPVFQYYSVYKTIKDSQGNTYSTLNLGLQGPPAFGFAPINLSLPIAFAMNARSNDGILIRTGYLGTGLMLNENNKDSMSMQDYLNLYGNVALWSGLAVKGVSTLYSVRTKGINKQITKSGTQAALPPLVQSMKGGRDAFLSTIGTLPLKIAAQSFTIATGDVRMMSLRLRGGYLSMLPIGINALVMGAFSNHLYDVFKQTTQPYVDREKAKDDKDPIRAVLIGGMAITYGIRDYYKNTFQRAKELTRLEGILLNGTDKIAYDMSSINIFSSAGQNKYVKGAIKVLNIVSGAASPVISKIAPSISAVKQLYQSATTNVSRVFSSTSRKARYGKSAIMGGLFYHFITDPKAGLINPEVAFGDLKTQEEDKYTWSPRRLTTVAGGALLFAATAHLSGVTPATLNPFQPLRSEEIFDSYRARLETVVELRGKKGPLNNVRSWYNEYRLTAQSREVQTIFDALQNGDPLIEELKKIETDPATGKPVTRTIAYLTSNPLSNIKNQAANNAKDVIDNLSQLDPTNTGHLDLVSAAKADPKAVLDKLYVDDGIGKPRVNIEKHTTTLEAIDFAHPNVSTNIRVSRISKFAVVGVGLGAGLMLSNYLAQSFGYKDIQDAFIGAGSNDKYSLTEQIKTGLIDLLKIQTKQDREHSYDLAKGLVGPNFRTSKGEFLLAPENTVKGSINKAVKNLSNLVISNAPNTFVGLGAVGITVRPDDNDVRVRDYFQLQSASQDFSSAMYSMSAVFGLQELAKKGFLANTIIAATRGVDDKELNQAQLRSIATNIITAVYSQPIRKPKDRIKFTTPNKLMLEGMQGNRQLSMSVTNRLKNLQAMSYGTTEQLALYTLTNNMFVADPAIQNQFYKALRQLSLHDDQTGLGELNQNTLIGGRLNVSSVKIKGNNDNPFTPFKLTTVESNNEDAFFEMQGIAVQLTTNQYLEQKDLGEMLKDNIARFYASSSLQGLVNALPPGLGLVAQILAAVGGIGVVASMLYTAGYRASMNQASVVNTRLYEQLNKFYDKDNWFTDNKVEGIETPNTTGTHYLTVKRAGVVFAVEEGLTSTQIQKYQDDIDKLQSKLALSFDQSYTQFSDRYGAEYTNNKQKLEAFYNDIIDSNKVTGSTTTVLAQRDQLIARNYAKEFQPVMGVANQTVVTYNTSNNQRITEHLIDQFTQKQVLDAYLEGQHLQHLEIAKNSKGAIKPMSIRDFTDKYYKNITYDDLLNSKIKGFESNGYNIFGKDRFATRMSINLITEVYAAKYDYIIDTFFNTVDESIDDVFKIRDDNIYSKFTSNSINELDLNTHTSVKAHAANRRLEMKIQLRENIKTRMDSIFAPKKTGKWAWLDSLLTFVGGNSTVRDNIQGMTLQAGEAAMDTVKGIRSDLGGMFNRTGPVPTYLTTEAQEAVKQEIIKRTGQGVKGSMPVSSIPAPLQSQGATLSFENTLLSFGSGLMAAFQFMQFASMNLLTMRAAASISSSKTGEREKEMAREELAKEGFENIFAAMFWGTILSGELIKGYGLPLAGGLAAGYIGYEFLFNKRGIGMTITGGAVGAGLFATAVGMQWFSRNTGPNKWALSLGLAGLVMLSRGVSDSMGSAIAAVSPQAGKYIADQLEALNSAGRYGMRKLQDQSQYINLVAGGTFAFAGAYSMFKGGPTALNLGLTAVGALLASVGLVHGINTITENKDTRWEGASRAGLSVVANILTSKYIPKGVDILSKTIGAKISQEIGEKIAIESLTTSVRSAGGSALRKLGGDALVKNVAGKLAATKAVGSFVGKAVSGFVGGPWGATIMIGWSIFELLSILIAPEAVDQTTSWLTNLPTQVLGGYGQLLLTPSNQIYQDKRYRDLDTRNPMYFGTVTDALKQEWAGQVDTLTDFTGRTTLARNVGALDAPMGGYQVTSQGYGPRSLDAVEELALIIRSKGYNQLVTGRQFWNSRMDTALNVALVNQYMNITNQIQMQAWENDVRKTVEREKARITKAPIFSAKDYKQMAKDTQPLAEILNSLFVKQSAEFASNNSLVVNVKAQAAPDNNPSQKMSFGTISPTALKAEKVIQDNGTPKISFSKTVVPNIDQVRKDHRDYIGPENTVAQHIIAPLNV